MKLRFRHTLFILSLYSNAYAECKKPFEGFSKRFILQEKLDCNALVEKVTLRIGNASESNTFKDIGPTSYFLTPECSGTTKGINLNYNSNKNEVIDWSETPPSLNGVFRITQSCDGHWLAVLDTNRRNIINNTVDAAYCTYPPLVTYVEYNEDLVNEVTLRSKEGTILAHAKKTFVNGPTCYATWDVNYTNVDPTIISYILAWKDNSNLDCSTPPPTVPTVSPGAAAAITGVVFVVGLAAAAIITGVYFRSEIGNFIWAYDRIRNS